jgi:hypothetical protein
MTIKDYVTLTLSILAFLLSALTTYVNVISRHDEVRFVLENFDLPLLNKEGTHIVVKGGHTAIFQNVGNRPVVVTQEHMLVRQDHSKKCDDEDMKGALLEKGFIPTTFTSTVAEANKVTSQSVTYQQNNRVVPPKFSIVDADGNHLIPIKNQKLDEHPIRVCFHFRLATQSHSSYEAIVEGLTYTVSGEGVGDIEQDYKGHKMLYYHRGTIFSGT